MLSSDWSSDVCSSDLALLRPRPRPPRPAPPLPRRERQRTRRADRPRALLRDRRNGSGGWGRSARQLVRRRPLSAGGLLMLSDKLRVALDNLLPDPGEDESYLLDRADRLRAAAVLIAFTDRPDPGVILTQRPQWLRAHAGQVAFPGGKVDPGDQIGRAHV